MICKLETADDLEAAADVVQEHLDGLGLSCANTVREEHMHPDDSDEIYRLVDLEADKLTAEIADLRARAVKLRQRTAE